MAIIKLDPLHESFAQKGIQSLVSVTEHEIPTDAELACKVFEEFTDIATANRFDLNDGPLRFECFRQCLAGQAHAHWDVAVNNQANDMMPSFEAAVVEWFAKYFEPTAFLRSNTSYRLRRRTPCLSRTPLREFNRSFVTCSACLELLLLELPCTPTWRRKWFFIV